MALNALQSYEFGGVDSRSNPLNLPQGRAIYERNWSPQRDGHLQLRRGYVPVVMSSVVKLPIHSIVSERKLGGQLRTIFFQGASPKIRTVGGTISSPTVKGAPFSSSQRFTYAFANGMLYAFNGVDAKYFDGLYWRDIGVPELKASDVAGVIVSIGAANENAIAATSVETPQAGYQLYLSIYNRVTGEVGNRVKIGSRVKPTVASEIGIENLPALADSEWDYLVGRTADGAEVPYACMATNGDWFYAPNGQTSVAVNVADIDGGAELPVRNVQPKNFKRITRTGERLFGNVEGEPYLYYSESEADAANDGSFAFVGRWASAWPENNVETFPTGAPITSLHSYNGETWCHSREHLAILTDLASATPGWQGPWVGGCPSQEGYCETSRGPVWISSEKQLCTMAQGGPISISDEYERAELSRIGDQYLSKVQVKPYRDQSKAIDIVIIKAQDKDGNPFHVIHDFNLIDGRSQTGQGYSHAYMGQLGYDYEIASVQDDNEIQKIWAGGSDGQLYELFNGANDNGFEYIADAIFLINAGPDRPSIPHIEWYGDGNLEVYVAQKLDSNLSDFIDLTDTKIAVPGGEHDYHWRVDLNVEGLMTECKHVYLRLKLRSHSEDGNLELNDPPHIPLESYGRVFMVSPLLESERGH